MPTFGRTTTDTEPWTLTDRVMGCLYNLPLQGRITKVTAYLRNTGAAAPAKCAIYRASDKVLMGTTQEVSVTTTTAWFDFAFAVPFILPAGDYWIAVWSDAATNGFCENTTTAWGTLMYQNVVYPAAFPNPFAPTVDTNDRNLCIYATYSLIPFLPGLFDAVIRLESSEHLIQSALRQGDLSVVRSALS